MGGLFGGDVVIGARYWRRDPLLRGAGVVVAGLGVSAILHLFRISAIPAHAASPPDFLLAVLGFLGLSAGSTLACIGAHIHDRVEVSERWARRELYNPGPRGPMSDSRVVPGERIIFYEAERR